MSNTSGAQCVYFTWPNSQEILGFDTAVVRCLPSPVSEKRWGKNWSMFITAWKVHNWSPERHAALREYTVLLPQPGLKKKWRKEIMHFTISTEDQRKAPLLSVFHSRLLSLYCCFLFCPYPSSSLVFRPLITANTRFPVLQLQLPGWNVRGQDLPSFSWAIQSASTE